MQIFYYVNNLRSLKVSDPVEIKPITILVGRNSSGKSTFLRSLPLLRQSVEGASSAPLLWYGPLVDFGDFATSIRDNNPSNVLTFHFEAKEFDIIHDDFASARYFGPYPGGARVRKTTIDRATIEVDIGAQSERTVRKSVRYSIPSRSLEVSLQLAKDGNLCERAQINGVSLDRFLPEFYLSFAGNSIFAGPQLGRDARDGDTRVRRYLPFQLVLTEEVGKIIAPLVDKRIKEENILDESSRILSQRKLDRASLQTLFNRTETRAFEKLYAKWMEDPKNNDFVSVRWFNSCFQALSLCTKLGRSISEVFSSTNYVGPARARGERFYRRQELEVSEITATGENLPMFLASLSNSELQRFSEWVERLFGYGVAVQRTPGHISINLKRDKFQANVADTGYGVSQILPVLAQTWWITQKAGRLSSGLNAQSSIRLVSMEQPELHLHPGHQARLADVFVEAVRTAKSPTHFVIETHSESMINRIGELIELGLASPDDVQVLIFSSTDEGTSSTFDVSVFNKEGVLQEWPFGFFSY